MAEVFRALNRFVGETNHDLEPDAVRILSEAYIFPITDGRSNSAFDYMSSARDLDMWFIADRQHLRQSFEGYVPLLALSVDVIEEIPELISSLGLSDRLLTRTANAGSAMENSTQIHADFTVAFRSKAYHIARILPGTNKQARMIITKILGAVVYVSETVTIQWSVELKDVGEVQGRADAGRVKIFYRDDTMDIHIRRKDADAGIYPLDLREAMATLCSFHDPASVRLLDFILSEPEHDEISSELTRRGFPLLKAKAASNPELVPLVDDEYTEDGGLMLDSLCVEARFVDHTPNTKRFRRRRAETREADSIQAFLGKFNLTSTFREQLSQPWSESGAENLLAHACRLDNIDPWNLLRRNHNQWDELLKAKGKPPGVATGTFWSSNRQLQGKTLLGDRRNVRNAYPAVVLQDHRRNMVIKISNVIDNATTDEELFAAEHYVSKLFEEQLGHAYVPGLHWTSPLRTRAGLLPYVSGDETTSTFTFEDDTGALLSLLQKDVMKSLNRWSPSSVIHVEVIPTNGDLAEKFHMDSEQVHKAWRCHTEATETPSDIFVLARVINIRTKPRVALFVDPWRLHAEGHMNLESVSQYEATLSSMAARNSCIYLNETSVDLSPNPPTSTPVKSLSRWLHKRKPSQPVSEPRVSQSSVADTSYSYTRLSLGQARLLELAPGHQQSPPFGTVHHISVEKSPLYYALSYVWGPATKSYALQTPQGPIPITASLFSALKDVRKRDNAIYIWADAVCINQDDEHEKATQIRMLPSIFQSAETVLCWIGPDLDDSSLAIQTLLQIRANNLTPRKYPSQIPPIPSDWIDGIPHVDDVLWWSIQNLFERERFARVWVIQEVVLAKEVRLVCGNFEVDWEDIIGAIEICLDDQGGPLPSDCVLRKISASLNPVHALGLTKRAFETKSSSKHFKLLSLLDLFAYAKSTILCDKLFALLGIASDASASAFDPDYSSTITVVLRRFAREFIRRGMGAELLYRAGSTKSVDFTSWIPNWVSGQPCRTISTWRRIGGIFAAGTKLPLQVSMSSVDEGILQVMGSLVDGIDHISTISLSNRDIVALLNDAHAMIDRLPSYPTGEILAEIKAKVPIGSAVVPCIDNTITVEDLLQSNLNDEATLDNAFAWHNQIEQLEKGEDVVAFLKTPAKYRNQNYDYWLTAAAFFERLGNGRFFVTKRGYVGIAPDRAHVGDQICIVHGASVPFVLRPAKHPGFPSARTLIGETYVHGIMCGEALAFDNVTRETIYLK